MYDLDERGEASSKHENEISSEYQNFSAIRKIKYLDNFVGPHGRIMVNLCSMNKARKSTVDSSY